MAVYKITLSDGSTNNIIADAAFIAKFFPGAELVPEPPPEPEPDPVAADGIELASPDLPNDLNTGAIDG